MMNISASELLKVFNRKGYDVFENESKNLNLNICGIRTANTEANKFNDWLVVFWKYNGVWNKLQFAVTTDPGLYYRKNPINVEGTAIVKPDQYSKVWQLGKHQGKYKALVQLSPITVIRDFDRDNYLDLDSGREETGLFGINCHRANAKNESQIVGKWSAGCQVFADPDDYDIFINICKEAKDNWGNSFTYTLITEEDLNV